MIDVDIILAELVGHDLDGDLGDLRDLATEVAEFARDLQALVEAGLVKDVPALGDTRLVACDGDEETEA